MSLNPESLAEKVRAGDRAALARAITLAESTRPEHHADTQAVLAALSDKAGAAMRIGITGPPGVGKSTFIEALGGRLTADGHRVAVLAIDPSSSRTHGSILGDKTRMAKLSANAGAFIRPSPSSGALGGAGRKTREAILICEGAGFDIVIVETMGVGQSETLAADMTDTFLALMLPGAGDELQGVKKGLIEIADILVVNKADGDNAPRAKRVARDLKNAVHILEAGETLWSTPVLTCSAATGEGVEAVWETVEKHQQTMRDAGRFEARRREQRLGWLRAMVEERVLAELHENTAVQAQFSALEEDVASGATPAGSAAAEILETWRNR